MVQREMVQRESIYKKLQEEFKRTRRTQAKAMSEFLGPKPVKMKSDSWCVPNGHVCVGFYPTPMSHRRPQV